MRLQTYPLYCVEHFDPGSGALLQREVFDGKHAAEQSKRREIVLQKLGYLTQRWELTEPEETQ